MEYESEYIARPDDSADAEVIWEKLRDYYGTAMTGGLPAAVIDLAKVDAMEEEQLKNEAEKAGILRR